LRMRNGCSTFRGPKPVLTLCMWRTSGSLIFFAFIAAAQVSPTTGSIRGRVTDPGSAVIDGAAVRLDNAALGFHRTAVSQPDGVFLFPYVPPFSGYRISVESRSFQSAVLEPVTVYATETTVVNVELVLEGHHEQIEERPDAQIDSTNPTLGGTIDGRV